MDLKITLKVNDFIYVTWAAIKESDILKTRENKQLNSDFEAVILLVKEQYTMNKEGYKQEVVKIAEA